MKLIIRKAFDHIAYIFSCFYYRIRRLISNDLIIYIEYSGLGDHLFYSHIPKLVKEKKLFKRVFISTDNKYRSQEIKNIVWDLNPYVDGHKKGKYPTYKYMIKIKNKNLLDIIGYMYGLNINNKEPEIFYKPKFDYTLIDKILYDPNYISNVGKINTTIVSDYFKKQNIKIDLKMKLRERNIDCNYFQDNLEAASLEEFIDILFSVKRVYCLTTGTATLCAAIKKNAYVLYGDGVTLQHHHSKINHYIKIE